MVGTGIEGKTHRAAIGTDAIPLFPDGYTLASEVAALAPTGGSSSIVPTAVKTANFTAAVNTFVPCDTTSGSFTVTLPTAPADGSVIYVDMVTQATTNTVTIAAGGSDVFRKPGGATSQTVSLANQSIEFQYQASSHIWFVFSESYGFSQLKTQFGVMFNVKTYGAVGDGTTDDSTACQAAISACATAGGGIVYFPPGNFRMTAAGLTVSTSSVELRGAGEYATYVSVAQNAVMANGAIYLHGNSASRNLVRHQMVSNMTVCMGPTDGSAGAGSGTTPGIKCDYVTFARVENVRIFGFQQNIRLFQSNNFRTRNVHIAPLASTATCYGIFVDNTGNSVATENYSVNITYTNIDGTGATSATKYGIYCGNGGAIQDLFIEHVETDVCTYGIYLDGTSATTQVLASDCHLLRCVMDQCIYGLYVTSLYPSGGGQVDVDSCYYSSPASANSGIYVTGSSGVHIRGFQFQGTTSAGTGVQFLSSQDCLLGGSKFDGHVTQFVNISASTGCRVTDNSFVSDASLTTGIAVASTSTNLSISDNNMRGQSSTITTGLSIASGCTKIAVKGNSIDSGSVTTPISIAPGAGVTASDNTNQSTIVTSPTVTSGSAFTPSTAADTEVYLTYATTGTITSVTMGPSTGAENTVYGSTAVTTSYSHSLRVPVGWKVVVTLVTTTATAHVVTL